MSLCPVGRIDTREEMTIREAHCRAPLSLMNEELAGNGAEVVHYGARVWRKQRLQKNFSALR
jgi:hypothetical protein